MEVSPSDKTGVFGEGRSSELLTGFAAAGRWLRFLGSLGLLASVVWLLVAAFGGKPGLIVPGAVGAALGGYISLQLVHFSNKAIAAQQSGDLEQLSGSGRHLRNAVRTLGVSILVLLALFIAFVCYLVFFGGFHR